MYFPSLTFFHFPIAFRIKPKFLSMAYKVTVICTLYHFQLLPHSFHPQLSNTPNRSLKRPPCVLMSHLCPCHSQRLSFLLPLLLLTWFAPLILQD